MFWGRKLFNYVFGCIIYNYQLQFCKFQKSGLTGLIDRKFMSFHKRNTCVTIVLVYLKTSVLLIADSDKGFIQEAEV